MPKEPSQHGLKPGHLETLKTALQDSLKKNQPLQVWIFGSRASGHHRAFSDIDLLLESDPALEASQLGEMRESLEESSLPFKVDLVPQEQLFPPFLPQVMKERKLLVALQGE